MPNYIRWREAGATFFFTVVTYRRRRLFDDPMPRRMLRRALVEVRRKWPFDMFACVLLPDHLHCIWTLPDGDDDFSLRWAKVKSVFTKDFLDHGGVGLPVSKNRQLRVERGVWQPRFGNIVFAMRKSYTHTAITSI